MGNGLGSGRRYPRFFYPGEPLLPDELRVTVLGSGSPVTRRSQAAAGMLVETGDGQLFVMDLGSGAFANLTSLEIPQRRLTKVFLTHLHCDHWADLANLYAMTMIYGRTVPLEIWGPSGLTPEFGTAAWGEAFRRAMAWDIESRRGKSVSGDGDQLVVHEFDYKTPAWIYDVDGVRIKAFPALHCLDGPVSYRLEWGGHTFVFAGDTKPNRFFVEHGQDADLMIYETFLPAELHSLRSGLDLESSQRIVNGVHSPPRAAGLMFAETRPKLAVMYHLRMNDGDEVAVLDDLRREYDGPVVIARDLLVFNVSVEGVTCRRAVTPEDAQPVFERPKGLKVKRAESTRISDWLLEAELRVDGLVHPGAGVF
jgi:ribonuclease Z